MRLWILYTLLAIAGILLVYSTYSPYEVKPAKAVELIQTSQATVLDVRTDKEREKGFYKGSIHIPEDRLAKDISQKIPDRKTKIVVYCATGRRAKHATEALRNMGYENAVFIRGTYTDL